MIDEKMEIINRLDEMCLTDRVTTLEIEIKYNNLMNMNVLNMIRHRLNNVQNIRIIYDLDKVDVDIMNKLKEIV